MYNHSDSKWLTVFDDSKKKKKKYFKNLKFKSKKSTFVTVSDVPYFQHYSCFLFDYVNILKGDQNKFNNHKHTWTHPVIHILCIRTMEKFRFYSLSLFATAICFVVLIDIEKWYDKIQKHYSACKVLHVLQDTWKKDKTNKWHS